MYDINFLSETPQHAAEIPVHVFISFVFCTIAEVQEI
jgi:hypothetical protein